MQAACTKTLDESAPTATEECLAEDLRADFRGAAHSIFGSTVRYGRYWARTSDLRLVEENKAVSKGNVNVAQRP
jgi:hypothetical protein